MGIYHVAVEHQSGVRFFYVEADNSEAARKRAVEQFRKDKPDAMPTRTELTASGWKHIVE